MIEPPLARADATVSSPGTLTASRIARATVAALSCTNPPAALTLPETSTSAWPSAVFVFVGTATWRKLSPVRFSVACSPEPIATFPSGTETTPEFETVPPSRPTKPPGPASNRAGVGDARGRAVADKVEITLVEVAVGDPERRGDETAADLNRAGRGDGDPVRIDEIDLAVGLQLTGDRRARRAGDAIQDRRGGARLIEGDAVHLPDRKAAPVDDRTRRGLDYGEVGARLTDRRRAGRNHAVRRQDVLGMRRTREQAPTPTTGMWRRPDGSTGFGLG